MERYLLAPIIKQYPWLRSKTMEHTSTQALELAHDRFKDEITMVCTMLLAHGLKDTNNKKKGVLRRLILQRTS